MSIHFHCFVLTKLQTTVQSLTITNFPNLYSKCVLVKYQVLSPLLSTKPLPATHQKIGRRPTEGLCTMLNRHQIERLLVARVAINKWVYFFTRCKFVVANYLNIDSTDYDSKTFIPNSLSFPSGDLRKFGIKILEE